MTLRHALFAFAVALVLPSAAHAQYLTGDRAAPAPEPVERWDYQDLPREHDRGWLVRLSAGPSWFTTRSWVTDDTTLEFRGGALDISAAFGGVVAPDVAVHLTGTAAVALSPAVRLDREPLETATGGTQLFGVAPGMTLFLPSGGYFSPSMGLSVLRVRFDEDALNQPEPLLGFLFDLNAGKQWWTHDRFSTGVAGRLTVHTASSNLDAPFRGVAIGVSWVATWN